MGKKNFFGYKSIVPLIIVVLLLSYINTKEKKEKKIMVNKTKLEKKKSAEILLTNIELDIAEKDEKNILDALLSKATYREAIKNMGSPEEMKKIKILEKKSVNNYYLMNKAKKNFKITPEEIKKVYTNNKKDLKGKTLKELTPAIKDFIYDARLKNEIAKLLNTIKEKNKIVEVKEEGTQKEKEKIRKEFVTNLSNATYKEAILELKSPKNKTILDILRRKAVNDYYIMSLANERVKVTPDEIKFIYEKNKKDLKGKTLEEVTPSIESLVYESKIKNEIIVILKDIKTKYKLEELVKKYI